jgi:hypothetical protein
MSGCDFSHRDLALTGSTMIKRGKLNYINQEGGQMKTLKVLFLLVIVVCFASTAMAANVLINGLSSYSCSGTMTVGTNGLSVDSSGNVNLNVTCSGSGCTNTAPSINVTNAPTTGTIGQPVSATFTASDSDAGQTPVVTANVGTISGNTWSWTPTANGTQNVTLTANDQQTCNNTASHSWSIVVGTPTGGCTTLAEGPRLSMSVPSLGSNAFCFTLNRNLYMAQVYITTMDWQTNQDVLVSDQGQPSCDQHLSQYGYNLPPNAAPWYVVTASSNETVSVSKTFTAGTTIYATVCNRTNSTGNYAIYWKGY